MITAYARVSTTDQDLTIQLEALNAAGAQRVFAEKLSGTTTEGRDQLDQCLAFVREGDVLIVTRLDRLARSMADLSRIVAGLSAKGVGFRCLNQPAVDTTNAQGRLMLNILGAFAEFETDLRKERQREGIEKAKAKGVYKGRPAKRELSADAIVALKERGLDVPMIAAELGCSRRTIYRRAPGVFTGAPEWLGART